jgi:hypothetical protein
MLQPKFNAQQIRQYLAKQKELIENSILERFNRLGEVFVTNARNNNTYQDQSGNLRSSIGYMIFKNGEVIFEAFPGSQSIGVQAAKEVAQQVFRDNPNNGFVFIGVAGMEYALAVESKGYDVITGSSIVAETALKKSMKQLQEMINKAA